MLPGKPFSMFNVDELSNATDFVNMFSNRLVAHYGTQSYTYSGKTHNAKPLSSNPYLASIVDHVMNVISNIKFNSILVTKYCNGSKKI